MELQVSLLLVDGTTRGCIAIQIQLLIICMHKLGERFSSCMFWLGLKYLQGS